MRQEQCLEKEVKFLTLRPNDAANEGMERAEDVRTVRSQAVCGTVTF
ncbi:MAG: hypothetical protein U0L77_07040 [Prevotellamassilia sp.]|nr:hypothetical protein [Prevotellamassilia sp.]